MKNVIAIPHINENEIERFLKIARFLKKHNSNTCNYEFLLINKKTVDPSRELLDVFSSIAPSRYYGPETIFNSFPEGPDEFFWKTMDYVNDNYEKDGGFVLWLESDMIPKEPNWVDIIANEWKAHPGILVMGLYFPEKFYIKTRTWVSTHINGGGCYPKDLSASIPAKYRKKYFDVSLFEYIKKTGKYHSSDLFKFSHMYSLPGDVKDNKNVILHGYRQNKDEFIQKAIKMIECPEFYESEKKRISEIAKKDQICCDLAVRMPFLINCPVHEKNTFLTRSRNSFLYHLTFFLKYIFRGFNLFCGRTVTTAGGLR